MCHVTGYGPVLECGRGWSITHSVSYFMKYGIRVKCFIVCVIIPLSLFLIIKIIKINSYFMGRILNILIHVRIYYT